MRIILGFLVVAGLSMPAFAQGVVGPSTSATPRLVITLGAGASFDNQLPKTALTGWVASMAWPLNDVVAVVGEVSGGHARAEYGTDSIYTVPTPCEAVRGNSPYPCPPSGIVLVTRPNRAVHDVDAYTLVSGIRVVRRSWWLRPFAHVLAGAATVRWEVSPRPLPPDAILVTATDEPSNGLTEDNVGVMRHSSAALQVGGGLDIPIFDRLALRLALDSQHLVGQPRFTHQLRTSAHLAWTIGRRKGPTGNWQTAEVRQGTRQVR